MSDSQNLDEDDVLISHDGEEEKKVSLDDHKEMKDGETKVSSEEKKELNVIEIETANDIERSSTDKSFGFVIKNDAPIISRTVEDESNYDIADDDEEDDDKDNDNEEDVDKDEKDNDEDVLDNLFEFVEGSQVFVLTINNVPNFYCENEEVIKSKMWSLARALSKREWTPTIKIRENGLNIYALARFFIIPIDKIVYSLRYYPIVKTL